MELCICKRFLLLHITSCNVVHATGNFCCTILELFVISYGWLVTPSKIEGSCFENWLEQLWSYAFVKDFFCCILPLVMLCILSLLSLHHA